MRNRLLLILGILLSFSLLAAACGDDSEDTTDSTDSTPDDSGDTPDDTTPPDGADPDAFAGCPDAESTVENNGQVGLVFDVNGRGDQSFNDSAAAGLDRAVADFGLTFTEAVPNEDGSDRGPLLQLAADDASIVIAVGFLFAGEAGPAACENLDTHFAVIDDAMLNFAAEGGPAPWAPNAAGLTFAEEQGSYLVGVAAGLTTETNEIGFIGGVQGWGLIEKFEAGFVAGVASVNPDANVTVSYIAENDVQGFFQPDRAREIATSMYEEGADIVYHAAGDSGGGLFIAAKEWSEANDKVWAIGVDSDQALTADEDVREYILTSMLKRVDNAVYQAIEAHVNGEFVNGNTVYDLATGGVGYSTTGDYLSADTIAAIDAAEAAIIAGDVVVPTAP
ncbi:MAG: BMP family ABC transporter substrate-binding protein [Acidimicrobiales bacterium]